MKNMLKLGFILTAYTLVACVGLAFVYAGTKTVIEQRAKSDLEAALKELFPTADSFQPIATSELKASLESVVFTEAYTISAGATLIGVAVKASGPSYGGQTVALVGVGADRKVAGAKILENKDTPGLGANAASPSYFVDRKSKTTFMGQFSGKSIDDQFKVKGDVVAITASTITSVAVANVVKAAGNAAGAWIAAKGGN
ncbi:MAG: electron transporter RnfG [Treponema sp. GWB1_62_6]|nr:MAG: electron transporter RnfG [Treponema sp. GWA1_62_8]OHE64823.1 MAG: electron transporter RnfG [Treponema sp. GWC1_61_84]OHE68412.1 MAG: electron transporter RnfG [Treponema sp. GWB1_62_6]HCM27668.1 electron transporter RnfG [Treponema sp.]